MMADQTLPRRRNSKMLKKARFSIIATVIILALVSAGTLACTSVLVTPGASVDGSATVTHTADCGSCAFEIEKVPAKDWEPGAMVEYRIYPKGPVGEGLPRPRTLRAT